MGRKHDILPPPMKNRYGSVSRDYCVENEDHRTQGERDWASALLRRLLNSANDLLEQAQVPAETSLFPVRPLTFTEKEQRLVDSSFSSKSFFGEHHPEHRPSPTGTAGCPQL